MLTNDELGLFIYLSEVESDEEDDEDNDKVRNMGQ